MNILEIEDMIKGLPDQALQEEAQAPSGQVPQFLVVSEIQRRTDMRKRFQSQQQQPQNTVSDQIVQEGIAAIAPQQMPQQMPSQQMMPQQMYSGGIVEMRDMGSVPYSVDMGRFYDMYGPQSSRKIFLDEEEEEDLYRPQFTDMQSRIGEIISENNPNYVLFNQSMNQSERIPSNVSSPKEEANALDVIGGRIKSEFEERPFSKYIKKYSQIREAGIDPETREYDYTAGLERARELRKEEQKDDSLSSKIYEENLNKFGFSADDLVSQLDRIATESSVLSNAQNLLEAIEGKSSADKNIETIEEGKTNVDSAGILTNAILEDSGNKELGQRGNAASSATPSGKAGEDELQDITDTESLLAQLNALRSTGREVKQPNYQSFKNAAEIRADKIREESRRDAYSQALIQFGAGVAEGDMAKGLRDAGLAVSKERSEGRKLATEEQRIQEAYALKIEEAESEAEKVRLERESDALTLASTVLGEMGKTERSVRGVLTAILRDPTSAALIYQQAIEEAERLAKLQGKGAASQTDILNAYKKALLGFSQTFSDPSNPQVSGGQIIDFDERGIQRQ